MLQSKAISFYINPLQIQEVIRFCTQTVRFAFFKTICSLINK